MVDGGSSAGKNTPRPATVGRPERIGVAGLAAATLAESTARAGLSLLAREARRGVSRAPFTLATARGQLGAEEKAAEQAARLVATRGDVATGVLDVDVVQFKPMGRLSQPEARRTERVFAWAEAATRVDLDRLVRSDTTLARALRLSSREVPEAHFTLDLVLGEGPDEQIAAELGLQAARVLIRRAREMARPATAPVAAVGEARLQRQAESGEGLAGSGATGERQDRVFPRNYPGGSHSTSYWHSSGRAFTWTKARSTTPTGTTSKVTWPRFAGPRSARRNSSCSLSAG